MSTSLKGINTVVRNLNRQIKKINGRSMKGLLRAAIFIRRRMDEVSPLVPVYTGNLRGSWFVDPFYIKGNPALRLGFTADYAWHVHENVGANFRRPGAGAKFFQAPLKRDAQKILNIIADSVRV